MYSINLRWSIRQSKPAKAEDYLSWTATLDDLYSTLIIHVPLSYRNVTGY